MPFKTEKNRKAFFANLGKQTTQKRKGRNLKYFMEYNDKKIIEPSYKDVGKQEERELELWIDNNERLYKQKQAMYLNLDRKRKRRVYDKEKAVKLFEYLTKEGARSYAKENLDEKRIPSYFDKHLREHLARQYRNEYETENNLR